MRNAGDQLAQAKERIALALRHEIDSASLAKRDGVHSVNDLSNHLRQIARNEQIAVLPPIRHKLVSDLLAFSLRVDQTFGVCRADHLAGLFVQQDAQRRAIREAERAEIDVFGDERVNEVLASSAIDDSNQRSPTPATILVLPFIAKLKSQSSAGPFFRLDPFPQGAAQGPARRGWIGQVLPQARRLQRLPQIGVADANPLQSP